mmetsp:Transcript_1546/g.3904  ORF Transcript_1546/g.3904 Transcript_1546/m.3904 type:complete len:231 (+) Transcript_1546:603-1295(+)
MVTKRFVVLVVIPYQKPQLGFDSLVAFLCRFEQFSHGSVALRRFIGKFVVHCGQVVHAFSRQCPRETPGDHYNEQRAAFVAGVVVAIPTFLAKMSGISSFQSIRSSISQNRTRRVLQIRIVSETPTVVGFYAFVRLPSGHRFQLHDHGARGINHTDELDALVGGQEFQIRGDLPRSMGGDGFPIVPRFRSKDEAPDGPVVVEIQSIMGAERNGFRFGMVSQLEELGGTDL